MEGLASVLVIGLLVAALPIVFSYRLSSPFIVWIGAAPLPTIAWLGVPLAYGVARYLWRWPKQVLLEALG